MYDFRMHDICRTPFREYSHTFLIAYEWKSVIQKTTAVMRIDERPCDHSAFYDSVSCDRQP